MGYSCTIDESGCGPFDRIMKKDGPFTGNVWGDAQHSGFIRTWTDVTCNGFDFAPGDLQRSDLKGFAELCPLDRKRITDAVDARGGGILYRLQHFVRAARNDGSRYWRRVVHGYILTDQSDAVLLVLLRPTPGAKRSESVLAVFKSWLCAQATARARRHAMA